MDIGINFNGKLIGDIDGIPVISFFRYVPKCEGDDNNATESALRELLWRIKDGEKDVCNAFTQLLFRFLKRNLRQTCKMTTLAFTPASTLESSLARWGKMAHDLSAMLDCDNGFGYLMPARESVPRHFIGRGRPRPLDLDEDFFVGKKIILIDDLINTGETMCQVISELEDAGGEVVLCIAIAHTSQEEVAPREGEAI